MKFRKIEIEPMSWEEAEKMMELIRRDEAKPVIVKTYDFKLKDGSDPRPDEICPSCRKALTYVDGEFCPYCGQRVDKENEAL